MTIVSKALKENTANIAKDVVLREARRSKPLCGLALRSMFFYAIYKKSITRKEMYQKFLRDKFMQAWIFALAETPC